MMIALLLAMAGCGSAALTPSGTAVIDPSGGSVSTATPGAVPTDPPSAATQTADPAVVATFEKSGGIAGIVTKLVVWSDGRLEFSSQGPIEGLKTGQATPEQVAAVQAVLESPEFQALNDRYAPADACCDFFTYVVSSPTKTVMTLESQEWPAPLAEAIKQLLVLESQATTAAN